MVQRVGFGKSIHYAYEPGSINSLVLGDGKPPTFNDGNPYFMAIFQPLRTWVDEFPSPMEMSWDVFLTDPIHLGILSP